MVGVIFSLMARLIHGRNEQGERPWQKTLLWAALHSPAGQAGPDGGWTENRPEQGGRPGDAGAQPGGKGRLCWACSITSTQGEAGRREGALATAPADPTHTPLHSPSGRIPTPPQGRPWRGSPFYPPADAGSLSHTRALGPGDPKPPPEGGLMTRLVPDWALSETLRDKQLQRGQASR